MLNYIDRASLLLKLGAEDIQRSLLLWRFWLKRAFIRVKLNYQGSKLGQTWLYLSLIIVALVIGSVWSILLDKKDWTRYIVYLLCGLPTWQLISAAVNSASGLFSSRTKMADMPLSISIFEQWAFGLCQFVLVLPLVLIVPLVAGVSGFSNLVYLPLAMLSLILWSIGIISIVSIATMMWQDLRHLIKAIMRLAFLATPIIWEASRLGEYQSYVWFNPFFPVLEFVRYALSGITSDPDVVWITPLYSLAISILGFVLLSRYIRLARIDIN